jgi:hypothetical protein
MHSSFVNAPGLCLPSQDLQVWDIQGLKLTFHTKVLLNMPPGRGGIMTFQVLGRRLGMYIYIIEKRPRHVDISPRK